MTLRRGCERNAYLLLALFLSLSFLLVTRYDKVLKALEQSNDGARSHRTGRLRAAWLENSGMKGATTGTPSHRAMKQGESLNLFNDNLRKKLAEDHEEAKPADTGEDQVVKDIISSHPPSFHDVTISTHLSADRYERLVEFARRWSGPIVAAVYIRGLQDIESFNTLRERIGSVNRMVNASAVISVAEDEYPINELRNKAFDLVQTELMLLLDIDMIPSQGLYAYIKKNYDFLQKQSQQAVLVVPAFTHLEGELPLEYDALKQAIGDGSVTPALMNRKTKKVHSAHHCTDYEKWYEAEEPYEIKYVWPCEPYIIGNKKLIPRYDERFTTYGNNKVVHIYHIGVLGFKFIVIPKHFVIHQYHKIGSWNWHHDKSRFNSMSGKVHLLTKQFEFELKANLGIDYSTGKKFSPGAYIVVRGDRLVWDGNQWINSRTQKPDLPYRVKVDKDA